MAEFPLWEEQDPAASDDDVPSKHKRTKRKKPEKALWQKLGVFFAGKKAARSNLRLVDDAALQHDEPKYVEHAKRPETVSLPDRSSPQQPDSRTRSPGARPKARDRVRQRRKHSALSEM
ncbi:uncharacterized protein LOC119091757 [Pollicipes pollicipes]|uniref:uncharacterized protein LOC119091757 n=1 Tax=Pollicipes pollicipes TaxID=41117 RepID=UPI001884EA35|nr:uncharacterized protein LOC119091757 [Pollicipes pollicipes]